MKQKALEAYRCPVTGDSLRLADTANQGQVITNGTLVTTSNSYSIENGMPVFAASAQLGGTAHFARNYYASIANSYDENVHITFDLYNENESDVRLSMINLLNLNKRSKVLEISAGTGKDSELIVRNLDENGELWLLDISPDMLIQAKEKIEKYPAMTEAAIGDACNLPYVDNYFDALYCFAGIGHFVDQRDALKEMARVVRPGGRVVFSEKNVPPWLRDTTYGRILINNNPMFEDPNPLAFIPVEARNVGIRWILGNVHYVVDYSVGEGEPIGNFDLKMPGERGGTFNTRYYGKLEGVAIETKNKVIEAQKLSGKSMHEWLDEIIQKEADKILNQGK